MRTQQRPFTRGDRTARTARARARAVLCVLSGLLAVSTTAQTQTQTPSQPPRFQSSVEVTSIDVTVVDDRGKPFADLTPAEFLVRVDGNLRRVVTAEWVSMVTPEAKTEPAMPVPPGYTSNESATGGRLIVMAIDEPNIRFGGAMGIARAANAFVDRLSPSDRIAVAGFGTGAPATVFTADRARVKQVISRMAGQKRAGRPGDYKHNIALTEALLIYKGDRVTLESVQMRECSPAAIGGSPALIELCRAEVEIEATMLATDTTHEADQTITALRDLLIGLRAIDAPKTLILISEGFILSDQPLVAELGTMAAEARTSLYALRLDSQIFDITDSRAPINPFGDRQARAEGMEMLAGASRGTIFTVATAEGPFFQRIESELSGYYLLGVESDPRDRDGKPHPIRVEVQRRGAIVRSRRQLLNVPAEANRARTPRQSVVAALSSPLLSAALPLRVASFSLQGPERDKIQMVIHADVGTDYASSKAVALGYLIIDSNGRVVDNHSEMTRLLPVLNGVPSSLQYTAGASLPPGNYTLKLAAAEGERVGSIEHPIRAGLETKNGLTLSELIVGGPTEPGEFLRPTIGYTASFGSVHGYVEAYGSKADTATVKYEIVAEGKSEALMTANVAGRLGGDERMIFSQVMLVHQLPPGKYVLRALVSDAGTQAKTLTRDFEVAPPKVLMTSADGLGATSTDAELFLPVDETAMKPAFRRDHAVDHKTLAPFLERVAADMKSTFDSGVSLLATGEYAKAELTLKKAIDPDTDSTAALTYLAASFAASGHDDAAASAWQTALVDGDEIPQIYQWLADALMRKHDYAEARTLLEEASGKWPNDMRFTKPLAMLYATFGKGREAVRTLERYLEQQPNDTNAAYLAVEWIYHVHAAGAAVHNRADDLKLAHTYAAAYEKASGPQLALVKQWLDFLQKEKR
jgi:VWFA-related protein